MADGQSILVVDDDAQVRKLLLRYLRSEGFQVSEAADGKAMRGVLEHRPVDLVLLDLIMPGEDGLALMRDIRRESEIPVIMITGKGEVIDRVVGLETGADDYIAKPFHLREVLARIRSVLRRSSELAAAQAKGRSKGRPSDRNEPPGEVDGERLSFAGWSLDLGGRALIGPSGAEVELTTAEFNLLRVFARSANRPLDRDQLMDRLKGRDWHPLDRSIDTQVGRLRKKIEEDPRHPELIKTVRGVGYVFTPKVTAA